MRVTYFLLERHRENIVHYIVPQKEMRTLGTMEQRTGTQGYRMSLTENVTFEPSHLEAE